VPDARVTKVEDALQQAVKDPHNLASLNLEQGFPLRPGYGTRGAQVTLWANYVEMAPSLNLILYRYDIAVSPSAAGKKLSQIIRLFLETPEMTDLQLDMITDFKSTLISRQRLERD